MNQSKIFTKAELKAIGERKKGNKADKTGIYSARVKPKILELLTKWFPKKKELEQLTKKKKLKNDMQ